MPCRRKENRVTLQARVCAKLRRRDLGESDFTTCGKELVRGGETRRFAKEGANARMRHGYRVVLSISQAGSVPDKELSLKVPLPCESGNWTDLS